MPRHEISPDHPECPERIGAVMERLKADGLYDFMAHFDAPEATDEALARAHTEPYIELLRRKSPNSGSVTIDGDTAMNVFSLEAARRSAGAGVLAVDRIMAGEINNAFCLGRPPGHHAERFQAMGFCLFGNVAVAARHAIAHHGLERVAIIDFDVHHGNGTEDIVDGDEHILFCSSFQHPFYPGGYRDNVRGQRINVPLRAGTGSADFRAAVTAAWFDELDAWQPELVIISAGFDAHHEDPLASLALREDDFAWLTRRLMDIAAKHANGRVVSMLEGGYALSALGRSASAHVREMMGI